MRISKARLYNIRYNHELLRLAKIALLQPRKALVRFFPTLENQRRKDLRQFNTFTQLKQHEEIVELGKRLLEKSCDSYVLRTTALNLHALGREEEATSLLEHILGRLGLDVEELKRYINDQLGTGDIESSSLKSLGGWVNLGFFHV